MRFDLVNAADVGDPKNGRGGVRDPALTKRAQVAEEIVRLTMRSLRERLGRGPEGYRTYLVDDMIVIRLLKALTPVEYEQSKTAEGRSSIKDTRRRLIQDLRPSMEDLIKTSVGAGVISIHSDLSTKTGRDIQDGYRFLFMGVQQAIRNPAAHEPFADIDDNEALELLSLASHLMRQLDRATAAT